MSSGQQIRGRLVRRLRSQTPKSELPGLNFAFDSFKETHSFINKMGIIITVSQICLGLNEITHYYYPDSIFILCFCLHLDNMKARKVLEASSFILFLSLHQWDETRKPHSVSLNSSSWACSSTREQQPLLFGIFLSCVYLITVWGNITISLAIVSDLTTHSHVLLPGPLLLTDLGLSSTTVPRMPEHPGSQAYHPHAGCLSQIYFPCGSLV